MFSNHKINDYNIYSVIIFIFINQFGLNIFGPEFSSEINLSNKTAILTQCVEFRNKKLCDVNKQPEH